jgi:hypothetical protein
VVTVLAAAKVLPRRGRLWAAVLTDTIGGDVFGTASWLSFVSHSCQQDPLRVVMAQFAAGAHVAFDIEASGHRRGALQRRDRQPAP